MTAVISHHPQQLHYDQGPSAGPSTSGYGQSFNHSVMEDVSDEESGSEEDFEVDPEQQRFYEQQQRQSLYYQQHQQQNGGGIGLAQAGQGSRGKDRAARGEDAGEDEDMYSDDESSAASIPDEHIDPGLTYALHTFLATVEGQASVVKGDSLHLLDDTNAYWWLVRVLKTEDVGYIPAENIETPYERLARLNKHRNVDLAHPTIREKEEGAEQGRDKMRAGLSAKRKMAQGDRSDSGGSDEPRRVIFAPPTYVEPSIRTWSSDEEGESGDEDGDDESEGEEEAEGDRDGVRGSDGSIRRDDQKQGLDMEPDDGVEWADGAGQEAQRRIMDTRQAQQPLQQQQAAPTNSQPVQAKSNNPFAQQRVEAPRPTESHSGLDPAQAGETRRITVTPAVAQNGQTNGVLLPSAVMSNGQQRNVSGQSINSVSSTVSTGEPTSPPDDKKLRKMRKSGSQDSLSGSERGDKKEKKRSMLGGLFSRKGKDKKGISSSDPRVSEESIVSGAIEGSPSSLNRKSEESVVTVRAPTPAERQAGTGPTSHSLRLKQQDQATMQAYSSKYLKSSPTSEIRAPTVSEAAAAVAQSAAAMRLNASMNGATNRPSSIIVSPNPATPLLNVMRIFAGEHIKSDASFKTVLLNDTITSADLIRQVIQRFRIHHSSQPGFEANFFLTVKDVNGEEMELEPHEKPLAVFLDTVQRCTDENGGPNPRAITPTVKRSSISSISSIVSLSSHPAIAKLGMNDFSDDSVVKIYLNRRRPGSTQFGARENGSEMGSYSSQLSTVLESSPKNRQSGVWSNDNSPAGLQPIPDQPYMRYNPSLTINTKTEPSPERFSSPSARFTVQLLLHPSDLPDGSVFDPLNDAIISRQILRERMSAGHPSQGSRDLPQDKRRRLFMLPRNATVLEAIEQGLERFGIQEGVVDGGDDVEERAGKRSGTKVRYSLVALSAGKERSLAPSSKLLEAYHTTPTLKPVERTTPEQRRRSREWSYNAGSASDILPSDPVFILRRANNRHPPTRSGSIDPSRAILQQQQQQSMSGGSSSPQGFDPRNGAKSPQEIIAAQRAASRATQKALISAHENKSEGIDVVLENKGTLRSSRLLEPTGDEVVRYSFIDDDGETYDISELLEEEWGHDGTQGSPLVTQMPNGLSANSLRPPAPNRQATDQSVYVTAPSTPEPGASRQIAGSTGLERKRSNSGSMDILKGVVERSAGKPEGKLEEKIARVIDKVKSGKSALGGQGGLTISAQQTQAQTSSPGHSGRTTPSSASYSASASIRPSSRALSPLLEGQPSGSPSSTTSRTSSRQANPSAQSNMHNAAATVNRIISKHRQQPSIASILSDISTPNHQASSVDHEHDSYEGTNTPATATSSSHPTPPLGTSIFLRAVNSTSPTPRTPVRYTDDFGMKTLMGLVEARARELRPKSRVSSGSKHSVSSEQFANKKGSSSALETVDDEEVMRLLWGEKMGKDEMDGMQPGIRECLGNVQSRLDAWDLELDDLLVQLGKGVRI